jgi:hypothetical protein
MTCRECGGPITNTVCAACGTPVRPPVFAAAGAPPTALAPISPRRPPVVTNDTRPMAPVAASSPAAAIEPRPSTARTGWAPRPHPVRESRFGHSLWSLVLVGAATVAGALLLFAVLGPDAPAQPVTAHWKVGACVAIDDASRETWPVACDAKHEGIVVATADTMAQCPEAAAWWVPRADRGYCVRRLPAATTTLSEPA